MCIFRGKSFEKLGSSVGYVIVPILIRGVSHPSFHSLKACCIKTHIFPLKGRGKKKNLCPSESLDVFTDLLLTIL